MPRVKDPYYPKEEDREYITKVVRHLINNSTQEKQFFCCIIDPTSIETLTHNWKLTAEGGKTRDSTMNVFKTSRSNSGGVITLDIRVPEVVPRTRKVKKRKYSNRSSGEEMDESVGLVVNDEEPRLVNINRFLYNAFHFLEKLKPDQPPLSKNNFDLDVSHLCDKFCVNPRHMVLENRLTNMSRQRCLGYIAFQNTYVKVCSHEPTCTRVSSRSYEPISPEQMTTIFSDSQLPNF